MCKISKNYHRYPIFFQKIEQIVNYLVPTIKQSFTNTELFNIFKRNKRFLLFLLEKKIIEIDENIFNLIYEKYDSLYFYPEIQPFLKKDTIKNKLLEIDSDIFSEYEEKRQNGENDSYICQLIRNDSIEDFVSYVNRNNFSLSNTIKPSIFETNPFLIKQENQTLIEYAAFFGSIQIFQYLRFNNVRLKPSLWLYAIHGKNGEIIHLLEENDVKLTDLLCTECYEEAIKCHHNDIANYFKIKYMNDGNDCQKFDYCYRYFNYELFQENAFHNFSSFCFFCKYNYKTLVKLYFKNENEINFIENSKVFNHLFFGFI